MDFTVWQIIALLLVGAGAGFVQRISGFGLGIFAMLFFPHIFGNPVTAAAVSCLCSCVLTVYNAVAYRRHIRWRLVLPPICAAAATIPLAVGTASLVPRREMTLLLGGVLILLSLYFLLFSRRIRLRPTLGGGLLAGALGGILSGLFATGGPPMVLYLAEATEDKTAYFASIQVYFALTNLYATAMRAATGALTLPMLGWAAAGMLGCLLGDGLGRLVFLRLDARRVKQVIYVGMLLSGVLMLVQTR